MRHGNKVNALGRKYGHRQALMSNLAVALITHKRIRTTTAKAKALRSNVEPIINRAKSNTTHSRRMAFRKLQDKTAVTELFDVIGPKIADRPGGYCRILKTGTRAGDNAEMAIIELVDFNENMLKDTKKKTRRSRKTRRGSGAAKPAATTAEAPAKEEAAPAKEVKAESTPTAEATEAPKDAATEGNAGADAPAKETDGSEDTETKA